MQIVKSTLQSARVYKPPTLYASPLHTPGTRVPAPTFTPMLRYLPLLLLLTLPQLLPAWGANGHRIVAQICYDNLNAQAREARRRRPGRQLPRPGQHLARLHPC